MSSNNSNKTEANPSVAVKVASSSKSEDELGLKWDRCLQDSLIKMGSGVGLGIVFSVVLFKRRPWPVIFGTGVGLGMAFANCQHDFRQPFLAPGPGSTIKITDPQLIETILKNQGKN